MFALRGVVVSFSVFVTVYCALSLAVCCVWRRIHKYGKRHTLRRMADLLFTLRIFPLVTAAFITAAFTVPSFLLLEPRTIDEPLGGLPLALGLLGAALGIYGLINAGIALRRASSTIARWVDGAQPVAAKAPVPVLRISRSIPALTAAGIARPQVLLSSAAEFVLTANELQTALNHEIVHIHRRDNLKKLLFRFVAFPGLAGLEAAWSEATEMAADDAAVSNAAEALDLAAALIKVSRLTPVEAPADLTAALVQSPASIMNVRVGRLIAWSEERRVPPQRHSPWLVRAAVIAAVAAIAVTYTELLVHVHTATEWLVQ